MLLLNRIPRISRALSSHRKLACLVVSEVQDNNVSSSTLATVKAASSFNSPITLLLAGHGVTSVIDQAKMIEGLSKVIYIDNEVGLLQP